MDSHRGLHYKKEQISIAGRDSFRIEGFCDEGYCVSQKEVGNTYLRTCDISKISKFY